MVLQSLNPVLLCRIQAYLRLWWYHYLHRNSKRALKFEAITFCFLLIYFLTSIKLFMFSLQTNEIDEDEIFWLDVLWSFVEQWIQWQVESRWSKPSTCWQLFSSVKWSNFRWKVGTLEGEVGARWWKAKTRTSSGTLDEFDG